MPHFKDNFSKHSNIYVKFRPTYPDELFEYLSTLTKNHDLAWDCGTGNGQSAISLTSYYKKVYATDPSEEQLKNAKPHPQVMYKVEKAEECGLSDHTVDVVTIAQALHWFDFDKFYTEVRRVLKPNGIIAAWAYKLPDISPEVDALVRNIHDDVLDDYWQTENRMVEKKYTTIPFPFGEITPPPFILKKEMILDDLVGLINSWSALQRFIDKNSHNPVDQIIAGLQQAWGNPETKKEAVWNLILKVGRV